ncbi:CRISPR-associated protein Cas2 [Neisseria sp. HSC-16F19]|nr:CRISPR-associated endonuclease Cas2 [Neisseria sp. HSC-16F19]MCP2041861.1 CRISPR-associated protein Cas2 [Neisseria sp. HSC-16F19]
MRWLIAYDIACPARLQRVYRTLCGHALPLQNSVFLLQGEGEAYRRCLAAVLPLIHAKEDDVRVYPLPKNSRCLALGGQTLPEGVCLPDYAEHTGLVSD